MAKRTKAPPQKKANEANKYDKIIKENLEGLIPALLRTVVRIGNARLENLPQIKLQTTFEREPDFLKIMYSAQHPEGCILQIEFESKDSVETDFRILEYFAILFRKFKKPVVQHVVHLGKKPAKKTKGKFEMENLSFYFTVHSICEISYTDSSIPTTPKKCSLASSLTQIMNHPLKLSV